MLDKQEEQKKDFDEIEANRKLDIMDVLHDLWAGKIQPTDAYRQLMKLEKI